MSNQVVRTEVLAEEVDGERYYGVLEVRRQGGRLLYRVHYGPHVLAGKDDGWRSTAEDDHNMRQLALAQLGEMIGDYPRA